MGLQDVKKIMIEPITRAWSPNLAAKIRLTPHQKGMLVKLNRFKDYRERLGRPVRFWMDPLATDEIRFLRGEIARRDRIILKMASWGPEEITITSSATSNRSQGK